jgi:hypothetical protein
MLTIKTTVKKAVTAVKQRWENLWLKLKRVKPTLPTSFVLQVNRKGMTTLKVKNSRGKETTNTFCNPDSRGIEFRELFDQLTENDEIQVTFLTIGGQ